MCVLDSSLVMGQYEALEGMTKTISYIISLFIVSQKVTNFLLTKECLVTSLLQLDNLICLDMIV